MFKVIDFYWMWFAVVIIFYFLYDNLIVKVKVLGVIEGDIENGEEVVIVV